MRTTTTSIVGWLAASAVAVVLAWQGVAAVGGSSRAGSNPVSIGDLTAAVTSTTTSVVVTEPPTSSTTVTAPPTTIVAPPTTVGSTPTTTAPTQTTTPTTTAPAPEPVERTYNLVGGSAKLRFTAQGVSVVWATPNPGFDVEKEPEHGNGVKVEFESETHKSRVSGWWLNGPQDEVSEEAGGG